MASFAEQMFANTQGAIAESKPVDAALQGYQFAQNVEKQKADLEMQKEDLALKKTESLFKTIEFGATKVPKGARKAFGENVILPKAKQLGFPIDETGLKMILGDEGMSEKAALMIGKYFTEPDIKKRKELLNGIIPELKDTETFLTQVQAFEGKAYDIANKQEEFRFKVGKDVRTDTQEFGKFKDTLIKEASNAQQKFQADISQLNSSKRAMQEALKTNNAQAYNAAINGLLTTMQGRVSDADFRLYEQQMGIDRLYSTLERAVGTVPEKTAQNTLTVIDSILKQKSAGQGALRKNYSERAKNLSKTYGGIELPEQIMQSFGFPADEPQKKKFDPAKFAARIGEFKAKGATDAAIIAELEKVQQRKLSPAELKQLGLVAQ